MLRLIYGRLKKLLLPDTHSKGQVKAPIYVKKLFDQNRIALQNMWKLKLYFE